MHHNIEGFYVGIRDTIEVRRAILESSKDIIESLKKFQSNQELKDRKLKEIHALRSNIRELNRLISRLRSALPKTKLRQEVIKEVAKPKKSPEEEKQPKKLGEIDKLEAELNEIESRLREIS